MTKVRAFNIPVRDMVIASKFYSSVFDWRIDAIKGSGGNYHSAITSPSDDEGMPLEPGTINGGLFQKGTNGVESVFLELEVDDIDETIEKVVSNGGKIVRPKRPLLDFAQFAIVQDPDGNFIGLIEIDRT